MINVKNVTQCKKFKTLDQDFNTHHRAVQNRNCKECVYFSSKNCGMEVSDAIEPNMDIF